MNSQWGNTYHPGQWGAYTPSLYDPIPRGLDADLT